MNPVPVVFISSIPTVSKASEHMYTICHFIPSQNQIPVLHQSSVPKTRVWITVNVNPLRMDKTPF